MIGDGNIRIVLKADFNEHIEWNLTIIIINQQLYIMIQYVYTIAGETFDM